MKKYTIYLVGQISPKKPITYDWRVKVEQNLAPRTDIEIINPCANNFNQESLKNGTYAVTEHYRVDAIDVLVPKDRTYVMRSDIAIVNMNQYDENKPLLGSFFELAWYRDYPEKTVIAFADNLNEYSCQHPFVQQSVTTWCNNEEEACYIVNRYFN